jgi:hypothetical protein
MTYQPKGSMCTKCEHKHSDCSRLQFDKMRKHEVAGDVTVVICNEFSKQKAGVIDLRRFGQAADNYEIGA